MAININPIFNFKNWFCFKYSRQFGIIKLMVPRVIAVAPASINSIASSAVPMPPPPITGIFTLSERKEEAWQFIKFLFEPNNQIKLYEKAWQTQDAYLPPNINTWEKLPMKEDFKEVLKSQALDAKGPPPVLGWDTSTRFVDQAIQRVILTNKDAKGALKQATRLMDEEFKKTN